MDMKFEIIGDKAAPTVIWGHGWGQNRQSMRALAGSLEKSARHILVDFPGFGETPLPPGPWGTEDYADAMAAFIKSHAPGKIIWVGHSFGCRVGLQLAARHPDLIAGLFLIAAAGLKRYRPWHRKYIYMKFRIFLFKTLKKLIPAGHLQDKLRRKFGSADYINAGPLRQILVKVINEDLTEIARTITCPVTLVYGENDTETPPEIGERLKALIPKSDLTRLQGQDHYTVLGSGQHQVALLLKNFLQKMEGK